MVSVHVIGAGLSGLSAAVRLQGAGLDVRVYEAAGHGGGRCRSYHDAELNRRIDNGNHLLLSGNGSAFAYLNEIGTADSLIAPVGDGFSFFDLKNGQRWTVPTGLACLLKVPGGRLRDYWGGFRLSRAKPGTTVSQILASSRPIFRNFWEPLSIGVLNIAAAEGDASLMAAVLAETLIKGAAACAPRIVREGLSESFIDPAMRLLGDRVQLNSRLKSIDFSDGYAKYLKFVDEVIDLKDDDFVVLAVPPKIAGELIPGLEVPTQSRAIVNAHFLLDREREGVSLLGFVGGISQWLFVRRDIASVTVSAADDLAKESSEVIAKRLWCEVALALDLDPDVMPRARIVKEKRATFAQTPQQIRLRPGPKTPWRNLFLAGDWTNTGLPATIEGSIRSGHNAAAEIFS